MGLPLKTTRTLQLVTVAMLFTSLAQLLYWLWDEAAYMGGVQTSQFEQFELQAMAGQELLRDGHTEREILAYFPTLVVENGEVHTDPELLARLDDERRSRLFRYGSEGTFLLFVIAGGIAVLTQALKQPAELLRRQQNFIAAVSHEFKSPLASIKLAAETLQLREVDRENQTKLAGRMVQDTERLEAMVKNILDAGRLSEGHLELHPETLELFPLVAPLLEKQQLRASLDGVELRSDVPERLAVRCDRVALVTVVENLIGNAVKSVAAAKGGAVSLRARADGEEVCIEVRDEGVGFDPAEAAKLFEKFYRPGDELRRRTEGSGLGLYIVKVMVDASGGRVTAESGGEGHGATFRLWLPRAAEVAT